MFFLISKLLLLDSTALICSFYDFLLKQILNVLLGEFKHTRGKIYSEVSMHNGWISKSSGKFIRSLLTLKIKIFQSKIIQLSRRIEITIFARYTLQNILLRGLP